MINPDFIVWAMSHAAAAAILGIVSSHAKPGRFQRLTGRAATFSWGALMILAFYALAGIDIPAVYS